MDAKRYVKRCLKIVRCVELLNRKYINAVRRPGKAIHDPMIDAYSRFQAEIYFFPIEEVLCSLRLGLRVVQQVFIQIGQVLGKKCNATQKGLELFRNGYRVSFVAICQEGGVAAILIIVQKPENAVFC